LYGKRLLVAGGDAHPPSLWDLEKGAQLRVFQGHQEPVWAVAFSHDGKRILTSSGGNREVVKSRDDSIRLWDTASGRGLRRFEVRGRVRKVEFSADDGAILGVSNEVTMWDAVTGAQLFHFSAPVSSASTSPKGHLVTINEGERLRIVDYISGRELGLISRFDGATDIGVIWSEQFNSDGTLVVTACGNTARIWNTDGTPIRVFAGHSNYVIHAAFADAQHIVTASLDHFAILWDARTGRIQHSIYTPARCPMRSSAWTGNDFSQCGNPNGPTEAMRIRRFGMWILRENSKHLASQWAFLRTLEQSRFSATSAG